MEVHTLSTPVIFDLYQMKMLVKISAVYGCCGTPIMITADDQSATMVHSYCHSVMFLWFIQWGTAEYDVRLLCFYSCFHLSFLFNDLSWLSLLPLLPLLQYLLGRLLWGLKRSQEIHWPSCQRYCGLKFLWWKQFLKTWNAMDNTRGITVSSMHQSRPPCIRVVLPGEALHVNLTVLLHYNLIITLVLGSTVESVL